ncbi:CRISPR-associated helicase Cas3' [Cyclobacterium sp. 1_MG-2023]|uniref:CRISPR-associated helicase Cas3' n=1 Tax=Cyclobacterium sp. 1_MG-2023 TaxID=3062681 RepID=UPI0026E14D9F|nr:CRISPR-associated helicase Cas3' [Cyclobacterium sp. 1_MG-2023]MDO6437058.1 CRISPR-associated helicase Cas3' [Cyclobacterium sp. 1_MG-2023]
MKTIESHPGIPLINHLKEVAKNCLGIANANTTNFGFDKKVKADLLFICGFYHDLGKATSYFQYYLHNPDKPHNSLKNHALPSAVFVLYVAKQYLKESGLTKDQQFLLSVICFIVVRRHHGNLGDFKNEMDINHFKEDLEKQYNSIDKDVIQKIIQVGNEILETPINWDNFVNWFENNGFSKETRFEFIEFYTLNFQKKWEIPKKSEAYYLFLWMFGALLFSDKSDVILAGKFPEIQKLDLNYLTAFRKDKGFNKPSTTINNLKNDAYFSVIASLENKFEASNHFYSITLPTGLGKTLTSLGAALKLKELAKLKEGKIIIAIPFTSIIDQNYEVYREVFNDPDNSLLLKHHHLAEPKYKETEDAVRDSEESQFLIETWQSSVVVTTFVQLLECLITNNKTKLLKFSALSNSVIILDEVQQIPHPLWEVIRQAFFSIAEHLNCYIILMSATQPLIFKPGEEITELVDDHQKYFSFFNRTRLVNKTKESISLDEFIEIVIGYCLDNPKKDVLIILNTKKTTLETYRNIYSSFNSEKNEVFYLTTLITPFERKKIIDKIKSQSNGKRQIIVSTQLVEAGVDISVNIVFRVLAPLDSIIQAAGRANRYDEKGEVSEVYLYKIEELEKVTGFIYGSDLIKKTENVLIGFETIEEKEYLQLIQNYFEQVKDLSVYSENNYLKSLLALNFEETGGFQLIEDTKTESIFISLNENARRVWRKFLEIKENDLLNIYEKKKEFTTIKSEFYDYVINISVPFQENNIGLPLEPNYGFYYIDLEDQPKPIYNSNPDFSPNKEGYVFENINVLIF